MTRAEINVRHAKIVQYKLEGHTFQQTRDWARKRYGIASLSQIFNIWRKYTKEQENKKLEKESNTL